jgi:hypothetical protein
VGNKSSLSGECHGKVCPSSAEADVEAMHTNGVAANIGLTFGALGLGAGAVILLLFPEDKRHDVEHPSAGMVDFRAWLGVDHVGIAGRFP